MVNTKPTGTSFLPEETLERCEKGNPTEKVKLAVDPVNAWVDIYEYARKIREGEMTWKDMEKADIDTRVKYVGMLHRNKRTPGQFLMRLKVPNGIVNSDQMRFYADSVEKYGAVNGVVDITTRANIQLRGVKLEDAGDIIDGLHARNQTSFQSALDSVRNMVGSPLAGIDDHELVDTRVLCNAVNDLISMDPETETRGNPQWANLPRKFNIAISGSRDDFAHTHINDIGLQPCVHAETGEMGFNVVLGGFMSIKRVAESVDSGMWIKADRESVVTFCEAILRIFRDESERKDRQKARLMWLVEKYGVEDFKKAVIAEVKSYDRGVEIFDEQPRPTEKFERRELLGVHPQKQVGKVRVGIMVPAGRLSATECRQMADLAEKYSDSEIRLTVEQNAILPNVAEDDVYELLKEPTLNGDSRFRVNPGFIEGNVVSCTGAEFCSLAMIETKSNAEAMGKKLETLVTIDRPIRIHWTGCPNSCGQVQAADIGIMGGPARKMNEETGKMMAVPGCKIFVGGRIGEDAHLSLEPYKTGIPIDDESLLPELVEILKAEFGAVDKK
ncbi:ferredoxin-nitrite reductase [Fragilariopsis cylindrus CCMP1102]|uniref:Ferredoxin--nitrite reductase, chloroplastic n=1 Tax=Fragilariopsis cylindrus CCMP1102 TaxID=635003 RepID=A0A1E7FE99_9STRA|nr:ferredoxin-nitrite reductase [Fragilariopsis cylindrus CCMP1102]|eukprot:OEU16477.1 ferredoxin-nitrite reductase [Fragilariopsis cylindrus CCMP1102]